jgi:hypothetical protein
VLVGDTGGEDNMLIFNRSDPNCDDTADFFHVGYPGYPDLSVTPVNGPPGNTRNFKDKLSSYSCTDE